MRFNWPSLSGSTRHRPLITSCVPTRGSARSPFWKGLPSSIPNYPDKRNRAMQRAGLLGYVIRQCPRRYTLSHRVSFQAGEFGLDNDCVARAETVSHIAVVDLDLDQL